MLCIYIAAILLLNGCTFHYHFKASRYPDVERGLKINKNTKLASDFEVIVIDNATRLHNIFLNDLNEKLNDLKENNLPFGGVTVILSGDFKQTIPIVIRSHQLAQIRVCIKKSPL